MHPFNFDSADNEAAAIASHSRSLAARYIAGGTTLVDLMKLDVEQPDRVVDISNLPLKDITEMPDAIRIGAMVSNSDCAYHPLVAKNFPVLSEALLSGASAQLRNLASVGGNLLQRTRCPYFRDLAFNSCNKRKPGSGCAAIEGYNRNLAILGTSRNCIASHPSDMCVALTALDATLQIKGEKGERGVPITEFYKVPGDTPHFENVLSENELIVAVDVPKRDWYARSAYIKVRDRASYAFALTSAAVALDLDGNRVREARVALGGVGTVPWRSREAEAALKGMEVSSANWQKVADAALKGARGYGRNDFKVPLAKQTLIRALSQVATQQGGRA